MAGGSINKVERHGLVRYCVYVDLPPGPDGKRRRRTKSCTTKKEAQAVLSSWLVEARSGSLAMRDSRTVADVLSTWLETYASRLSGNTQQMYEKDVMLHIVPHLGHIKVQALTPEHVLTWLTTLRASGLGRVSREMAHNRLKQALDQSVSLGTITRNVARLVPLPPEDTRPTEALHVWTEEQALRFLEVADTHHPCGPIFRVTLATGMRIGEALALSWDDVSWDQGLVRVRQTLTVIKGALILGPPKTPHSVRDVRLEQDVLDVLREHKTRQNEQRLRLGAAWRDHGLVFVTSVGTPFYPTYVRHVYRALVKEAGVPHIRIHDHRHTHATWAVKEGIDYKTLSERLGHKDISTTLQRYTHSDTATHRDAGDTLGAKISRKRKDNQG
jgi:integrase